MLYTTSPTIAAQRIYVILGVVQGRRLDTFPSDCEVGLDIWKYCLKFSNEPGVMFIIYRYYEYAPEYSNT